MFKLATLLVSSCVLATPIPGSQKSVGNWVSYANGGNKQLYSGDTKLINIAMMHHEGDQPCDEEGILPFTGEKDMSYNGEGKQMYSGGGMHSGQVKQKYSEGRYTGEGTIPFSDEKDLSYSGDGKQMYNDGVKGSSAPQDIYEEYGVSDYQGVCYTTDKTEYYNALVYHRTR